MAADRRDAFFFFSGAVDRHAFANDVVVADDKARRLTAVAKVLRLLAEHGPAEDGVVTSHCQRADQMRARGVGAL